MVPVGSTIALNLESGARRNSFLCRDDEQSGKQGRTKNQFPGGAGWSVFSSQTRRPRHIGLRKTTSPSLNGEEATIRVKS